MIIINLSSHPMTTTQMDQMRAMAKIPRHEWRHVQTRHVRSYMNMNGSFSDQAVDLINNVGLTGEQWRTEKIYLVPPGLSHLAMLTLLEIWKRAEMFPDLIRITKEAPKSDKWVVNEIIPLEDFADNLHYYKSRRQDIK